MYIDRTGNVLLACKCIGKTCNLRKYRVQSNEEAYTVTVQSQDKLECQVKLVHDTVECVCDRLEEISTWTIKRDRVRTHARTRILSPGRVEICIGGLSFLFTVTPIDEQDLEPTKSSSGLKSGDVHAIMPGRITSILVRLDEEVSVGTPLIILEAMKMQNEIVSHRAGRVASINVEEGDTVRKDDLLLQIR